jgi:phenylpyruvate tautomerase PptA (4-oxalocrotonate tautomerase family)
MPFIHIKSLPLQQDVSIRTAIEQICRDFSSETGTPPEQVTVTWDYVMSGHYAVAGKAATQQPIRSHPVLVDMLVPGSNAPDTIERMMRCVAESIAKHSGIPCDNVFINCRAANSGMVLDGGEVVRW